VAADVCYHVSLPDAAGVPVVRAPAEIDTTTAGQLRAILFEWHTRGHATLVVDMTGTQFCDSAGLRELVREHKRARAEGGELRLVLPADGAVKRVFNFTGLDRLIPHFAALEHALAQIPAAGPRRRGARLGSLAARAGSPAEAWERGAVADSRACEQCGTGFVPLREHARFCSADCRAAWNREHMGDPAVEASALQWSVTAMSEATGRLAGVRVWDRPRALAAFPSRGRAWEIARYRAYQARLVGDTVGQTFGRAVTFLTQTGANAASSTVISTDSRR
jgi:anti-sigma B factor antagonist